MENPRPNDGVSGSEAAGCAPAAMKEYLNK